jgi:solute carrier family 44 protein 1 (choline transporter-like protein)/choline transporter-like protein 2/4/5
LYIQNKIKQTGATQNSKVIEWFLKILTCYVLCFERFIKFLNKNAYIQIALNASSFCGAARDAFFLILRNAARFLAVGSIGNVFMFLGKWVITLGAAYAGYMIITRSSYWGDQIHSPIFPTVVFMLIAYTISGLFMSVYGMACDSILHCFLADEELSAKNRGGPSHSPEILADFMGKERQKDQGARCCDCC